MHRCGPEVVWDKKEKWADGPFFFFILKSMDALGLMQILSGGNFSILYTKFSAPNFPNGSWHDIATAENWSVAIVFADPDLKYQESNGGFDHHYNFYNAPVFIKSTDTASFKMRGCNTNMSTQRNMSDIPVLQIRVLNKVLQIYTGYVTTQTSLITGTFHIISF